MSSKIYISELEPRIKVTGKSTIQGIVPYDVDNCYPQRFELLIRRSPNASQGAKTLGKYVFGQGFADKFFNDYVLNWDGLTVGELLRLHSRNIWMRGIAMHVLYNAIGEKYAVNYVPFEYCRLGEEGSEHEGKIAVYDNWDKSKKKQIIQADIEYYDTFNDDVAFVLQRQEEVGGFQNYKGQIFWFSFDGQDTYPLSVCDSVMNDMDSDYQMQIFKSVKLRKGFMADHIMVYKGTFEDDQERTDYINNLQTFQGAENTGSVMLVQAETEESVPELIPIQSQLDDKIFVNWEKSVQNSIRKSFNNIPPVLVDAVEGKLGGTSGEGMAEAKEFYSEMTFEEREVLAQAYYAVFGNWYETINPSGNWEIKPLTAV
jgi:hypothetical protein